MKGRPFRKLMRRPQSLAALRNSAEVRLSRSQHVPTLPLDRQGALLLILTADQYASRSLRFWPSFARLGPVLRPGLPLQGFLGGLFLFCVRRHGSSSLAGSRR